MHELAIAQSILRRVAAERAKHAGGHVSKVGVRVGELSGVDSDALSFGFEVLVKDSGLEPLALEIEFQPWRQRCPACDREFAVVNWQTACPQCGAANTVMASGDQLDIVFLELEEA